MKKIVLTLATIIFSAIVGFTQEIIANQVTGSVTVFGTSNLHDWDVKAEKISGYASFKLEDGTLASINKLTFNVVAESLKSGKSGMDKNTYAALNTKVHENISYRLTKVLKITKTGTDIYKVETVGNLSIAGITKSLNITFTTKVYENKIALSGSVPIDMVKYNIEPPKALMGTIKTGKDVKIEFSVQYN